MTKQINPKVQERIEGELRRGTSKSRIATTIDMTYDEASEVIDQVKASIRPDVGDVIKFYFREHPMTGIIVKLLTNSAVVKIYWEKSAIEMFDICEERTIVNFKDIEEFI